MTQNSFRKVRATLAAFQIEWSLPTTRGFARVEPMFQRDTELRPAMTNAGDRAFRARSRPTLLTLESIFFVRVIEVEGNQVGAKLYVRVTVEFDQ